MPTDAQSAARLPRLILEAAPDGTLSAEFYINGARSRVKLEHGFELAEIKGILADLRADIAAEARRKVERQAAEDAARHRRVYWHSVNARGQGRAFADRVIGRPDGIGGAKPAPAAKSALLADASLV